MYQTRVSIFKVLKLYLFYFHNQTLTLKKLGNPFGVVNGIFLFLIGSSTEVLDRTCKSSFVFVNTSLGVSVVTSSETPVSINDPRVVRAIIDSIIFYIH